MDTWTAGRLLALTFDALRYPVISIEEGIYYFKQAALGQQAKRHPEQVSTAKAATTEINRQENGTTGDTQEAKCILKNLFIVISCAPSPSFPWAFAAAALSSAAVSTSFGTP